MYPASQEQPHWTAEPHSDGWLVRFKYRDIKDSLLFTATWTYNPETGTVIAQNSIARTFMMQEAIDGLPYEDESLEVID